MQTINVVWFKKDLRLHDHLPLYQATVSPLPVLLLFFFEPSMQQLPEQSARHWAFAKESLQDLQNRLRLYHAKIHIFESEVLPIFQKILEKYKINTVYSYQEIGQKVTFDRDKAFKKFCDANNIQWIESQKDGVVRGLRNREGWNEQWTSTMQTPIKKTDLTKLKMVDIEDHFFENYNLLNIDNQVVKHNFQKGGETLGWRYLKNFIDERVINYSKHISKPTESRKSCSRISPYLAWGSLSIRQVYQFMLIEKEKNPFLNRSMSNFESRLHWHCHFIQRFEMACSMEFKNLHKAFDQTRQKVDGELVTAWESGNTGIPLVDACMRCVNETGYLNFRMRAMLVSFLTHHLFQPWQAGIAHLARQFLDYEVGIHFCQFQMQASTMGTSKKFRIYNPTKQAEDHDPEAKFIKQWLPELQNLPTYLAIEPWKITNLEQHLYKFRLGIDYPKPIVDLEKSAKNARNVLFAIHQTEFAKKESIQLLTKHAEVRHLALTTEEKQN
jgi:deoxyribodipyrimidine photo-lyase